MADTQVTTPIDTIVDGYFAMWNELDPAKRRATIAATWAEEAGYSDPLFTAAGYEALDALVAAVHDQYPGYRFRRTSAVDSHHNQARWGWELSGPDGNTPAAGVDFAVLAPDGRLNAVTGFFEQPAQAA
jgi:hypothetical protein